MWPLTVAFVDVAFHRRGPQDLPASQFLLGLVLAVYLLIGLTVLQLNADFVPALTLLLVDTALYLVAIWVVLKLFDKMSRYLQTTTALVGTDAFLTLIGLPLTVWDESLRAPGNELTPPGFLILLLFLWKVDIGGFIFSKALGRPYIAGVSIVIVYVLTSMALREALFPGST